MLEELPPVVIDIINETLLVSLIVGCIFSLLIGLLLLIKPSAAITLNQYMSRWFSMRRPNKPMEVPHYTEGFFYRNHKTFGLFILTGAAYTLYQLGFSYHHDLLAASLGTKLQHKWLVDWLLSAMLWFTIPIMLLIFAFGAALAVRPSSLKGLETSSNQWISTRRWLLPLESQNLYFNDLVYRAPRKFALIIIGLSSYSLITLLLFYFH